MADDGPVFASIDRYIRGRRERREIAPITAQGYRHVLYLFGRSYGSKPVDRMRRSDVDRWVREWGDVTPSTHRQRLSSLKGYTGWLVREGKLRVDPCAQLPRVRQPRTVPKVFTADEVAQVLDACPDSRARLVILLLCQLGLRCVEVSRLELGDVSEGFVTVCGKGGHQRNLFLVPEVRDALNDYLSERGGRAGPLIENRVRPGLPLTPHTIGWSVGKWIREAGVKRYRYDGRSAHGFRRSAATDMLDNGAKIEEVAEVLGHANLATVQKYAKVRAERLEQAMSGRWYGRRVLEMREVG